MAEPFTRPAAEARAERLSPVLELTRTRLREFYREPGAVFWVFGFPMLLAIGLGIAFRERPPEKPRIALSGDVAWLREALAGGDTLVVEAVDAAAARDMLRRGKVDLVIEPAAGGEHAATYHFDALRPEGRLARLAADAALQQKLGRADAVAVRDAPVTERGARYVDFLLPALIGMNVMGSSMWGVGYALVEQRRRRLLKRLAATPMRRPHFLLSFVLSRLVFLVAEVTTLVVFGGLTFDVAVRGSYATVGLLAAVAAATFAGLALLIAARARSVEVASGWMNFIMMPMWMLSGTFFSYERFPEIVHPWLRLLPLTALNDAMRAVFNDGAGLVQVAPQLGVLGVWLVVSLSLALRLFRWQ